MRQKRNSNYIQYKVRAEVGDHGGLKASLPVKVSEGNCGNAVESQGEHDNRWTNLHDQRSPGQMT